MRDREHRRKKKPRVSMYDSYAAGTLKFINEFDEPFDASAIFVQDMDALRSVNALDAEIAKGNGFTADYDFVIPPVSARYFGIEVPDNHEDNPMFVLWQPDVVTSNVRVRYEMFSNARFNPSGEPFLTANLNDCLREEERSVTNLFVDIEEDPRIRIEDRIASFMVHGVYGAGFNSTSMNSRFRILRPGSRYVIRITNEAQTEAVVGLNSCFYEIPMPNLGEYLHPR